MSEALEIPLVPPKIAPAPPKKKIAIFLDGTWNAIGDNTNVWQLKSLVAPKDNDGLPQPTYYEDRGKWFLGRLVRKGRGQNAH